MVLPTKPIRDAAVLLLIIAYCNAQIHVVQLHLQSVRGDAYSDPGGIEAQTLLGKVSTRPDEIYCTDSIYPNDIFCELAEELDPDRELTDVSLEYAHPAVKGSTCTVNFLHWNSTSLYRLQHQGVSCTGRAPALPMTRVAYVLKIFVRSRLQGEQDRCTRSYTNYGKIGNMRILSPLERHRAPLRFTFDRESCTE